MRSVKSPVWSGRIACFALALWSQAAAPAFAWGEKGHRIAGAVADSRLTPAARAAVAELLDGDASAHEKSLAGISNWADTAGRQKYPNSGPWHYVNVPLSKDGYTDEFCDASKGCVVSKIREFRTVLSDRSADVTERRKALYFFVHLVQDIHQPLHVADNRDRGGSLLQLRCCGIEGGTNLHKVWDVDVIDLANVSESAWTAKLNHLANASGRNAWAESTPIDWANESLLLAKAAYRDPATEKMLASGDRLEREYLEFALPIVERRLAQAGVRLADHLNQIFQ